VKRANGEQRLRRIRLAGEGGHSGGEAARRAASGAPRPSNPLPADSEGARSEKARHGERAAQPAAVARRLAVSGVHSASQHLLAHELS